MMMHMRLILIYNFIPVSPVVKVQLVNNAQAFKYLQRAVYRGDSDMIAFFCQNRMQLFGG